MKNASGRGYRGYEEWDIEHNFNGDVLLSRLCQTWEIPAVATAFYLAMVFGGKRFMKNRQGYDLRRPMFVWSAILAIFSILGMFRTTMVTYVTLQQDGLKHTLCDSFYYSGPITRLWATLFPWSKFLEYIDTAFIILRKQNLIFLHWYHHLTVALFSWLMYGGKFAGGCFFMTLNYGVHAMMYSYYAIRAAGIKPPRYVAVTITAAQIIQMVCGCLVMVGVILWGNQTDCATSLAHQLSGTIMYGSYLVLFMQFFYKSYIVRPKINRAEKPQAQTSSNGRDESVTSLPQDYSDSLRKRKRTIA